MRELEKGEKILRKEVELLDSSVKAYELRMENGKKAWFPKSTTTLLRTVSPNGKNLIDVIDWAWRDRFEGKTEKSVKNEEPIVINPDPDKELRDMKELLLEAINKIDKLLEK